jgi:predicted rRNA methylase YqxC with S4 and FtsJ domains
MHQERHTILESPGQSIGVPMQVAKKRLDEVCFEQYPEMDRNALQSWIAQGKVLVNSRVVDKVGSPVQRDANISILAKQNKFVCRYTLSSS